ncbi:unnamed protein product, partial [Didymodactylos carnosus]
VHIPEPEAEQNKNDEEPFETTIIYERDGEQINRLILEANREKLNFYVRKLIDVIYDETEFINLDPLTVKQNEGYLLIKEAVRSRFKLDEQALNKE